jgi:hypothetical protein
VPAGTQPKQSASSASSRREKLASFEAARKKEQLRRNLGLLAICLVLAVGLLSYPVYLFAQDYVDRHATIEELGTSAAAAGCDPIAEHTATGNQEHVAEGTEVTYDQSPPDSGKHYPAPAPFTKRFYATADRPPVSTLVHNLEHGYTIVWYRSSLAKKQVNVLQSISKTFGKDETNPANKFIAAPWDDATDGGAMPAGKNIVITHWYADPADPGDPSKQKGVRQACDAVSGPVIKDFMARYPYENSPEPSGA